MIPVGSFFILRIGDSQKRELFTSQFAIRKCVKLPFRKTGMIELNIIIFKDGVARGKYSGSGPTGQICLNRA